MQIKRLPNKIKGLVLKLGGQCNLSCPHCHCLKVDFKFNKDILEFIKLNDVETITFSGGEPLLYWPTIKYVVESLGHGYRYHFVTNATLLTPSMVRFLNKYDFTVGFSYDGKSGGRDGVEDIRFNYLELINQYGITVTCYHGNTDIAAIKQDVADLLMNKFNDKRKNLLWFYPNFIHQTANAPNADTTIEDVQGYIDEVGKLLELDFISYKNGVPLAELPILSGVLARWFKVDEGVRGVRCCNENVLPLTIAGDFLLCPYRDKVVGDIYRGVNWNLVDSYLPERCRGCDLLPICRNQCVENITEHECVIFKSLFNHFLKLVNKYNVMPKSLGISR